jgi:hypothetical protein
MQSYSYTDADKRSYMIKDYPGLSYRAVVVNRALRRGEFLWVTVRQRTFPMFFCNHCFNAVTSAGVQGDHIIAQAHGGDDSLQNLQLLCSICNAADMHHRGVSIADRTRTTLRSRGERYHAHEHEWAGLRNETQLICYW